MSDLPKRIEELLRKVCPKKLSSAEITEALGMTEQDRASVIFWVTRLLDRGKVRTDYPCPERRDIVYYVDPPKEPAQR